MANLLSGRAASDIDTIVKKVYAAYHQHSKNYCDYLPVQLHTVVRSVPK